jgi:hypothetical protein
MTHPATLSFHCTSFFPLLDAKYEAIFTGGGLRITGTTPDATYVEIPTPSSATSSQPAIRTT